MRSRLIAAARNRLGTENRFRLLYQFSDARPRGGVAFYGTTNCLMLALDAETGAVKWEGKLGVGIVNSVVPLSAPRVLTTDFDGCVTLLEAKE